MCALRFVDLSVPIEEGPSEPFSPKIVHHSHEEGAQSMMGFFGCKKEDLPDGLGWANDTVTLITHAGTHLDAPWHFFPTSEGKRAKTIDEVPLEWCYGPGVVLDMRHKDRGDVIQIRDIEAELGRIKHALSPGEIVLIMTGADKFWGTGEYFNMGCGMGRESTLYLIERGIKVMGTDAWGFDRPFKYIIEEFKTTGNRQIIWEAHFAGRDREYLHLEKLANLDLLPPDGFTVICFPVKVKGASAGWTRPVAIIEK